MKAGVEQVSKGQLSQESKSASQWNITTWEATQSLSENVDK